MTKFDAGGYEIAVANVEGTFYAFSDICTHRRCSLSEGQLDGTTLECICHGSRFDVATGDVLRGPANRSVQVYAVRVQGDALVVDVPQHADGRPGNETASPKPRARDSPHSSKPRAGRAIRLDGEGCGSSSWATGAPWRR